MHRHYDLAQRSADWHTFRAGRVTASRAAAALGLCKYKSQKRMWAIMTGRYVEEFSEFQKSIMETGVRDEPVIARVFADVTGMAVQAWNIFVHPANPRIAASPDGIVYDGLKCRHSTLEIKRPRALYLDVPLGYWVQVQLQLQCTGCVHAFFIAWTPDEGHRIWEIDYSPEFARWSLAKMEEFIDYVDEDMEPPTMTGKAEVVRRWESELIHTTRPYDPRVRLLRRTGGSSTTASSSSSGGSSTMVLSVDG